MVYDSFLSIVKYECTETNGILEILFDRSHSRYYPLNVRIFCEISIVKSSKGKDQLILDGFRYGCANKSQATWCCVNDDCVGRVNFDGTQYIKISDHIHAPNPDEIIAMEFKSKVIERVVTSHDPPRRIIHEALLDITEQLLLVTHHHNVPSNVNRRRMTCFAEVKIIRNISIPQELRITNGLMLMMIGMNNLTFHVVLYVGLNCRGSTVVGSTVASPLIRRISVESQGEKPNEEHLTRRNASTF